MRKKIVLFSSILATLPSVFAAQHGRVSESFEKVFTALPAEVWNPILAFVLVAGIINGALSLTNLGKQGGDRRGFGLISGSLAGMFSIFVYTTKFNLMAIILPYLFLIIILFIFSIVMVFVAPQDDKRNAARASGTALIITGALLWSIDGAIANFSERLDSLKVIGAGGMDVTAGIFELTPYTTLLGLIFVVWGLSKVVSSFSDDGDNPSFGGGIRNMNPFNQPPSTTRPPKLEAHISGPGTAVEGVPLTGVRGTASGGVHPYTYTWDIPGPSRWLGRGASTYANENLVHTFTGTGNSTLKLTVRDSSGKTATKTWKINVTAILNAILTATDSGNTVIPTPGASPPDIITFNMVATGGTAPYTNYNWNFVGAAPAGAPPGAASTIINYPADFSGAALGTVITTTVIVSDSSTTPATFTATHTFTIT